MTTNYFTTTDIDPITFLFKNIGLYKRLKNQNDGSWFQTTIHINGQMTAMVLSGEDAEKLDELYMAWLEAGRGE